ncbi:MAG TPA: NAD(P)/FAD-dependent oxidoreductase, partial [Ktedonobacterales bacterium]|nr:NAD(P)/FAD-dependent oxidoreductase [Ktedonobacterales bacterium]
MTHISDVVIVGAGAAGLATAACLAQRGVRADVLEAGPDAGHTWASTYNALRLHTVRRFSGLPLYPMPRGYPRYAARDQVVTYLRDYAAHFGIQPHFGSAVTRATLAGDGWQVETRDGDTWQARVLVAASGVYANPYAAMYPGQETYTGTVMHSSEYRSPAAFKGQRVLVVGAGNSGAEIAVDLMDGGARVTVAIRQGVNAVPLSLLGVPIQYWALLVERAPRLMGALAPVMLRRSAARLRRAGIPKSPEPVLQAHGIPIIGLRLLDAARTGKIAIAGAIERFEPHGVRYRDGASAEYDAIILATGFRPAL